MFWLVLRAYSGLLLLDCREARDSLLAKAQRLLRPSRFQATNHESSFPSLHDWVQTCNVAKGPFDQAVCEKVCHAVDLACVFYFKEVLCLQRSALTAFLLRRHSIPARMVIGVQQMPFKAHAWVEVNGRVVNDKPYMRETFVVLDQC